MTAFVYPVIPDIETGKRNLIWFLDQADDFELAEGRPAYEGYNRMLKSIWAMYPSFTFEGVVASFCAMSPNNDYMGNLRSLVSVLHHLSIGTDPELITISTYNHCKFRAVNYLQGEPFDTKERGLKTLAFYKNILDPNDPNFVTIDGHMVAAYCNVEKMTMSEARISRPDYRVLSESTKDLAASCGLVGSQLQAIVWFVRKRLYAIKISVNLDLFAVEGDSLGIQVSTSVLKPYDLKSE